MARTDTLPKLCLAAWLIVFCGTHGYITAKASSHMIGAIGSAVLCHYGPEWTWNAECKEHRAKHHGEAH
jgi:hypothetical protein